MLISSTATWRVTGIVSAVMISIQLAIVEEFLFMSRKKRVLLPIGTGLLGGMFLALLYFGIVSLAESPQHSIDLFWQDRWVIIPIITGFGVQTGLYTVIKKRLFVPTSTAGPSGPLLGAGGGTSTLAMVACCAHHVTDVLPILGLTAAAAFLAQYRTIFMYAGLGTTISGIIVMLVILFRERRKALDFYSASAAAQTGSD
jgi:hypothetical protein